MSLIDDFRKDPRQAAVLMLVLTAAAAAAYIFLVLSPQASRISRTFSDIKKKDLDIKKAEALIGRTAMMRKMIEDYDNKVASYEKILPAEHGLSGLLEDLSSMAKESNMRIVGIVPVPGSQGGAGKGKVYDEIPIAVSATCGYHELGWFLERLDDYERLIKVADIQIASGRSGPGRNDVELLLLTYVLTVER